MRNARFCTDSSESHCATFRPRCQTEHILKKTQKICGVREEVCTVFCTPIAVFEIQRSIGRQSNLLPSHVHLALPFGVSVTQLIFSKLESVVYHAALVV